VTSDTVALRLIDAMHHIGAQYMLVGSFSSNYYGIPRSTKDIDLVIQVAGEEIEQLAKELGDEFNRDPQIAFDDNHLDNKASVHSTQQSF